MVWRGREVTWLGSGRGDPLTAAGFVPSLSFVRFTLAMKAYPRESEGSCHLCFYLNVKSQRKNVGCHGSVSGQ